MKKLSLLALSLNGLLMVHGAHADNGVSLADPTQYNEDHRKLDEEIRVERDNEKDKAQEDSRLTNALNDVTFDLSRISFLDHSSHPKSHPCRYRNGNEVVDLTDGGTSTCTEKDKVNPSRREKCELNAEMLEYCPAEKEKLKAKHEELDRDLKRVRAELEETRHRLEGKDAKLKHLEHFGPNGSETVTDDGWLHVQRTFLHDVTSVDLIPDKPSKSFMIFNRPISFLDRGKYNPANHSVSLTEDDGCTYTFAGDKIDGPNFRVNTDGRKWTIDEKNPSTKTITSSENCSTAPASMQPDCRSQVSTNGSYTMHPSVTLKSSNPEMTAALRVEADSSEAVVNCLKAHGYKPPQVYVGENFWRRASEGDTKDTAPVAR